MNKMVEFFINFKEFVSVLNVAVSCFDEDFVWSMLHSLLHFLFGKRSDWGQSRFLFCFYILCTVTNTHKTTETNL